MTAILTYILKWALSLAILYIPFALLLRKETFATLNRWLLLCIIILSALLPFIVVSYPVEIELSAISNETSPTGSTIHQTDTIQPAGYAADIMKIATTLNFYTLYQRIVMDNQPHQDNAQHQTGNNMD